MPYINFSRKFGLVDYRTSGSQAAIRFVARHEAGSGHGREALVESGGVDAAGCLQFGERPGLLVVRENCGDALIDRGRRETAIGLSIRLDWLERKSVVALDQFNRDVGYGGGRAMPNSQDDAIVAVAAEIGPCFRMERRTVISDRAELDTFASLISANSIKPFLRNNHLSGVTIRLVQNIPQRLCTPLEIAQDALPVALFVIGRAGIGV